MVVNCWWQLAVRRGFLVASTHCPSRTRAALFWRAALLRALWPWYRFWEKTQFREKIQTLSPQLFPSGPRGTPQNLELPLRARGKNCDFKFCARLRFFVLPRRNFCFEVDEVCLGPYSFLFLFLFFVTSTRGVGTDGRRGEM